MATMHYFQDLPQAQFLSTCLKNFQLCKFSCSKEGKTSDPQQREQLRQHLPPILELMKHYLNRQSFLNQHAQIKYASLQLHQKVEILAGWFCITMMATQCLVKPCQTEKSLAPKNNHSHCEKNTQKGVQTKKHKLDNEISKYFIAAKEGPGIATQPVLP